MSTKINFQSVQRLRPACQLAASFAIFVYFFDEVLESCGFLSAIGGILLVAILTTPLIRQIDHFRCLALLATHRYAPRFSEGWLAHAAKTTLAYDIHHFWSLAPLATHRFATHFTTTWLGFPA